MKITESLVSIIIPVYNASSMLPRCVESFLKQTYKNLEIIIVDDRSKDDSYKIARILKKCDSRIKVIRNKKRYGQAVCFNRALRVAQGQFVTFVSPTDVASIHKIKKQVNFLLTNSKTVAVGTQCIIIKVDQTRQKTIFPLKHEHIYPTLLHNTSVRFETVLINRHLLPSDLLKFTNSVYPHLFHDLLLKLLQYGQIANINQYLYWHNEQGIDSYKKQQPQRKLISYILLILRSVVEHDYRPSIKAFLHPFTIPVRTIFR